MEQTAFREEYPRLEDALSEGFQNATPKCRTEAAEKVRPVFTFFSEHSENPAVRPR